MYDNMNMKNKKAKAISETEPALQMESDMMKQRLKAIKPLE